MRCVLVLASGASWESEVLDRLREGAGLVVLKRCVDVDDLMASAATQQAELAVVSSEAPGLDDRAVQVLRRHGVGTVAVTPGTPREDAAGRLAAVGIGAWLPETSLETLAATLHALAEEGPSGRTPDDGLDPVEEGGTPDPATDRPGRVVVVWGPVGAPGRTTVATALAGELARRGRDTLLVDADPHASVAQHLGVLDQVSGLLAAARGGTTGLAERLPAAARGVEDHLAVLTGLPRPERQVELREGVLAEILGQAATGCDVVVDVGADLVDPGWRDGAQGLTLEALGAADDVVVVGAADPVGLARLARGLVELRETWGSGESWAGRSVRVVVNRMRPSLGWSRADVAGMVEGVARVSALHFLPDDRAGADRALVAGHGVAREQGSALAHGVRELVDVLWPDSDPGARSRRRPGVSRRRAGTARRR